MSCVVESSVAASEPSSYIDAQLFHRPNASSFQIAKDSPSTTVGCITSLPGNTPHVTAFTVLSAGRLDLLSPEAFIAWYVSDGLLAHAAMMRSVASGEAKNSR